MVSNHAIVKAEKVKVMDAVDHFLRDNGWNVRPHAPGDAYLRIYIPVQYGHETLILRVSQEM